MTDRATKKSNTFRPAKGGTKGQTLDKTPSDFRGIGARPKMVGAPDGAGARRRKRNTGQGQGLDADDVWGVNRTWRDFGEAMRSVDVGIDESIQIAHRRGYRVLYECS